MTARQKRKLIEVIRKDCKMSGKYRKDNRTCVIGALALVATNPHSKERKLLFKDSNTDAINESSLKPIRDLIHKEFGLTTRQMVKMQEANDSVAYIEHDEWIDRLRIKERREDVLRVVNGFRVKG